MKKSIVILLLISISFASSAQFICYPDMSTYSETCYGAVSNDTTSFTLDTIQKYEYHNKRGFKHLRSNYKRSVYGNRLVFADSKGYINAAPIDTLRKMVFTGTSLQVVLGNGSYGTMPSSSLTYNYNVSRSINSTSFTPSSTRPYRVSYNVTISCTASIGSSASGKVELQYYNGTTWVTVNEVSNSNTVTLAVTLNSVNTQTVSVIGEFAANTQIRLVPTSSGTTTITYVRGTEIIY